MVCGTVLPYILYTKGLNDLGTAARPPSWPRWSRWWPPWWASWPLGEPMTLGVVLGLVCILASVYILR